MATSGVLVGAIRSPAEPWTVADVYRAHADFVWRVVQRLGVPAGDAEDVVHEVFLVVQRRLPEFDGRGPVTSWLYAIARGVAANFRRGRTRASRRESSLEPPPPVHTPEEGAAHGEAVAVVEAFLAGLDDETRMVFELAEIEGMKGPEVAQALGIALARVHARLKTARRRFNAFVPLHVHGRTP